MDTLDKIIQDSLSKLPKWCSPEDARGTHEWEAAYTEPLIAMGWEYPKKDSHFVFVPTDDKWDHLEGPNGERGYWKDMSKFEDRLVRTNVRLPYSRCKHCHKRSNDLD